MNKQDLHSVKFVDSHESLKRFLLDARHTWLHNFRCFWVLRFYMPCALLNLWFTLNASGRFGIIFLHYIKSFFLLSFNLKTWRSLYVSSYETVSFKKLKPTCFSISILFFRTYLIIRSREYDSVHLQVPSVWQNPAAIGTRCLCDGTYRSPHELVLPCKFALFIGDRFLRPIKMHRLSLR